MLGLDSRKPSISSKDSKDKIKGIYCMYVFQYFLLLTRYVPYSQPIIQNDLLSHSRIITLKVYERYEWTNLDIPKSLGHLVTQCWCHLLSILTRKIPVHSPTMAMFISLQCCLLFYWTNLWRWKSMKLLVSSSLSHKHYFDS